MKTSIPLKIGILGGGQLARLMAMECRRVGAEPYVVSQNSDNPAAKVVKHWCQYRLPLMGGSNWKAEELRETESYLKLIDFISCTDLLTIESEFIDLSFLRHLSQQKLLCPSEKVLEITQSKLEQKKLFSKLNISTAEFAEVKSVEDIENALSLWGDVVIKKGQLGYDGNGVRFLSSSSGKKSSAKIAEEFYVEFKSWLQFEVYAERKVKFSQELALLVARDRQGNCEFFPLVFTEQKNGICNKVWIPEKPLSKGLTHKIQNSARKVLEKLDGIGVFAFELFLTSRGEIIFNEMAPRVHNSGHITLDSANVSQFEQHIRAIAGLGLIKPYWITPGGAMINIIGSSRESNNATVKFDLGLLKNDNGSRLYWYDKVGRVSNRKLGHINVNAQNSKKAIQIAERIRKAIKI